MAAVLFEVPTWEIIGLVALVMLLIGLWLNWRRQCHVAGIEEDLKNGKITAEQAWRRSRVVNWRATGVVFCGVALMVVFVMGQAW